MAIYFSFNDKCKESTIIFIKKGEANDRATEAINNFFYI